MGKKSVDETLGSHERDVDAQAYLITAESDTRTQSSRLLRALIKTLVGLEREAEDESAKRERLMELRRRWEEQLAREQEVNQVGSHGLF